MRMIIIIILLFLSVSASSQDTTSVSYRYKGNQQVEINVYTPNFYEIVKSRKFIPFYIFSSDKTLRQSLIMDQININYESEAFIFVEVNLDAEIKFGDSAFLKFIEQNLFSYIDSNFRIHDFSFVLSTDKHNELVYSLMQNNLDYFDFALIYYSDYFTTQPETISLLKESFAQNETDKSLNVVSYASTAVDQVTEFKYFNSVKFNIHYIWFEAEELKNITDYLRNLYQEHVRELCDIDFNLVYDDFQSRNYYFEQLKQEISAKRKLISARNLNELAYYSYTVDGDFAIRLLNYAISQFPDDINLSLSMVEINIKLARYDDAKKNLLLLHDKIELEKSKLDDKSYKYWIGRYEKLANQLK